MAVDALETQPVLEFGAVHRDDPDRVSIVAAQFQVDDPDGHPLGAFQGGDLLLVPGEGQGESGSVAHPLEALADYAVAVRPVQAMRV